MELDRTGQDALAFYLAYLHPAWMTIALGLVLATLRSGLAMRSRRVRGLRPILEDRQRHLRLAKPALAMIWIGFAAGLASSSLLRGWELLGSAHGKVSLVSLALFTATGWLGHQLEEGQRTDPERHAWLALAAVFSAAASLGTGFVLLP